ncbi:GlxA family transcriptional regulator [Membranihabitans maritimus]|uniref:GlxA family transcriptional regulator n=1 Tax=Membranihabitans maritimus TaxID=2904244 RepID=UPI001F005BAD|nr:helix-turn-helix domain-containing protein [Membranihabitans maritimus]
MNVAILLPELAVVEAVADPRYMFNVVNQFLKEQGSEKHFNIQMVGLKNKVTFSDGAFTMESDATIENAQKPDLVIIPALSRDIEDAVKINEAFIPWITEQYKDGAEIASLCLGAFLLASTGLLRNKPCSTHWLFANKFRDMFPHVNLVDDKIVTEVNGLYSSGGANSYWNLLLHLVEKYVDRKMAILVSKFFVLNINTRSQSHFSIFQGQKMHEDDDILEAQNFIEENIDQKYTVPELSKKFNIGKRSFERRFKKATQNTVLEYTQRVKVEAAKKKLEISQKTVSEIMFSVGYNDANAFRDMFKKITGMTPYQYRNKYNKEAILMN